jgi:hypothetical protein
MRSTVPPTGTGQPDDPRRPDLPEGTSYTVLADHGDTMDVEVDGPDERIEAMAVATRLTVADKVRDGLDNDTVASLVPIFPAWEPGLTVKPGEVYSWDSTLVECIQGHTTQADWPPDKTPALWKVHRTVAPPPGKDPDPWKQPTGAHDAYKVGDKVTFDGKVYESTINGNVWSPTAYPAGWKLVT